MVAVAEPAHGEGSATENLRVAVFLAFTVTFVAVVDGRPVSILTSAVRSARLSKAVALAFVHRDHAEPGTPLSVLLPGGPTEARPRPAARG
jgi:glycine cleavage system aminomethyltransferase T